jgi:hypothetical protein
MFLYVFVVLVFRLIVSAFPGRVMCESQACLVLKDRGDVSNMVFSVRIHVEVRLYDIYSYYGRSAFGRKTPSMLAY